MTGSIKSVLALSFQLAFVFILTSCKKNQITPLDDAAYFNHSIDQALFTKESDNVLNDANAIIETFGAYSGRITTPQGVICDASVKLDSNATVRTITITYDGTSCLPERTRKGDVIISMPLSSRWRDLGAVITIDLKNIVINRNRDARKIYINGVYTITNLTGGRLKDLQSLGTIIHDVSSSGIVVTLETGVQRTWQISKRRKFTYDNGIVISTTGNYSDAWSSGISEWGKNRLGSDFVTIIKKPMVTRQDCNFRLVSGEVSHERMLNPSETTFGLDTNGNPVNCPSGFYYMKVVCSITSGPVKTYFVEY